MNKLSIVLIIAIVVVGAWLWWMNAEPSEVVVAPITAPVVEVTPEVSPTSDIDADLGAIDIGDVGADFQGIDADLNQL
ncbi:MAG: hypothetical protein Q7R85_02435 [bacterium]|nr:hypothetical protein [bacterium]